MANRQVKTVDVAAITKVCQEISLRRSSTMMMMPAPKPVSAPPSETALRPPPLVVPMKVTFYSLRLHSAVINGFMSAKILLADSLTGYGSNTV